MMFPVLTIVNEAIIDGRLAGRSQRWLSGGRERNVAWILQLYFKVFEFWGFQFWHFLRDFQASLEVGLWAEPCVAVSQPDQTLHEEDEKAEENDEHEEHYAAHYGNLYVTQIVEEIFYFGEENFKICRKIYFWRHSCSVSAACLLLCLCLDWLNLLQNITKRIEMDHFVSKLFSFKKNNDFLKG